METIKSYLDNIFGPLPQTHEILRLKQDLLNDMEAKYTELRQYGRTENEAIGTVIAEFGNIDELIKEMNITAPPQGESSTDVVIPHDEVREYIAQFIKSKNLSANGVLLILIGVSVMIWMYGNLGFVHFSDTFPIIALFVFLIPAVGMFIKSDLKSARYKHIEDGTFAIDMRTKNLLTSEYDVLAAKRTSSLILGVTLILLGAVVVIVSSNYYVEMTGLSITLLLVGIGVRILISSSGPIGAYQRVLQIQEYSSAKLRTAKVTGAVASVVFPLATCVFLLWGFLFDGWGIAWIVYPVTGILFAVFCAIYSAFKGTQK